MQPNPEGGAPVSSALAKAGRVSVAIHVECGGIVDSVGLGHFCFMVYERAFHRIRPSALRD